MANKIIDGLVSVIAVSSLSGQHQTCADSRTELAYFQSSATSYSPQTWNTPSSCYGNRCAKQAN